MAKRSESESPELKAFEDTPVEVKASPKAQKTFQLKVENSMNKVEQVSSRSLPPRLVALATQFGQDAISNQAYKIGDTAVLWVASQKKIYFGADAQEASGDTMMQAAITAGIA